MQISDIRVKVIENRPYLKGTASIVIENAIKIRKISIIRGKNNEIFVSWPSEKLRNGTHLGVSYPINNDIRLEISERILKEYKEITLENNEDSV